MRVGLALRNMDSVWVEGIGLLAGFIGIIAWGPQIVEVWVHKRHDGLSMTSFAVVSLALMLWLMHSQTCFTLAHISPIITVQISKSIPNVQ